MADCEYRSIRDCESCQDPICIKHVVMMDDESEEWLCPVCVKERNIEKDNAKAKLLKRKRCFECGIRLSFETVNEYNREHNFYECIYCTADKINREDKEEKAINKLREQNTALAHEVLQLKQKIPTYGSNKN